jgi:hypothetical protein
VLCGVAATLAARDTGATDADTRQRSRQQFNVEFKGHARRELADQTLALLDEARLALRQRLGLWPDGPIAVVIYTEGDYAAALSPTQWEGARFDGTIRIAKADLVAKAGTLRDILYHEYVHALLRAAKDVPAWFNEGLAQYAEPSGQPRRVDVLEAAARGGQLPTLGDMDRSFLRFGDAETAGLAYAASLSLVDYMVAQRGVARLRGLLERLSQGESFAPLFSSIYAADTRKFEDGWRRSLHSTATAP